MNWLSTAALIMVAVAVIARLLWWAYGRSHQLASQQQGPAANPTESSQTDQGTQVNVKTHGESDSHSQRK